MCAYKTIITISNEIKHTIGLVQFYFQKYRTRNTFFSNMNIQMHQNENEEKYYSETNFICYFFQSYLIRFDLAIKIN